MKRDPYIQLEEKTIFGGKGAAGVPHHIISQVPYHVKRYEGFGGLARITQLMKPAKRNTIIDIDPQIIDVWSQALYPTPDINSQNLAILQTDFLKLDIPEFYDPTVFVFLDPPYPEKSIKGKLRYDFILTDAQHVQLLKKIRRFKAMTAITTYENDIYETMLGDWRKIQFPSQTRGGKAIETMYMNYPEPNPLELHDPTWQEDPSYKGEKKWRGREGLERRHFNFVRKLKEMSDTEQSLLFHALRDQFPYLNIPNPKDLFQQRTAALATNCEVDHLAESCD